MAYKSNQNIDEIELHPLHRNESGKEKKERSVNFSSSIQISGEDGVKASKTVQFSNPQVSFEEPNAFEIIKPSLIPNRKREEEAVMEILRKKVGEFQLDKNWKQKPEENEDEDAETKPLIKTKLDQTTDKDFIIDCLCWHNEYRARHNVPAMNLSKKLCVSAQEWANHLAHRNELYYCPTSIFNFGQSIFCCAETALMISISGQEVATYWYSSIKRYDYSKHPMLLHTNVNTGHFTQVIWKNSRFLGVGKSTAKSGKIYVVAFYYPPGNIAGEFHLNVYPPIADSKQGTRPNSVNSNNNN